MNIFITGGTGFLGQHVIKRLQKESFQLIGLVRSENSANTLKKLDVEPVLGSLENIDDWKHQLENIDVVIHCAAPVEFWGSWQRFENGIVIATQNIYNAAKENKVNRFIFISSESVLQDIKNLIDIDETEVYPTAPNSYYGKSKMLAEQFILAQDDKMTSIILRPTFIWGKGMTALDTIIDKIKSNDFMWINNGESLLEMVHVDNVSESIYLACIKGKNKAIYFVTDDNPQTVKEFLSKLIATKGIMPPKKNIPKGLANFLATIIESIWKLFNLKKDPPITKFDVAFVAMDRKYNITKIKNELGYKSIITESEGLKIMANEK